LLRSELYRLVLGALPGGDVGGAVGGAHGGQLARELRAGWGPPPQLHVVHKRSALKDPDKSTDKTITTRSDSQQFIERRGDILL
jgi:hypothetical protein